MKPMPQRVARAVALLRSITSEHEVYEACDGGGRECRACLSRNALDQPRVMGDIRALLRFLDEPARQADKERER